MALFFNSFALSSLLDCGGMTHIHLTNQKCEACEGGVSPLSRSEAEELLIQTPDWQLNDTATVLYRAYVCTNFVAAVALIHQVADIAEAEGHHPDIHLTNYKHLRIELTTHAINGLSKNDFIVAAKLDARQSE